MEIDLEKMFVGDPPTSLVSFLPVGFDEDMAGRHRGGVFLGKHPVKLKKGDDYYVDFTYGQPNDWDEELFKKYFPGATSDEEIKKIVRIVSQSYGSLGVGIPLSLVMF